MRTNRSWRECSKSRPFGKRPIRLIDIACRQSTFFLAAGQLEYAEQAIRAVGAETLAQRYVSELSDGERQKIMLARALAQEPQLMILGGWRSVVSMRIYIARGLRRGSAPVDAMHRHSLV